jgi:hypothetical protein
MGHGNRFHLDGGGALQKYDPKYEGGGASNGSSNGGGYTRGGGLPETPKVPLPAHAHTFGGGIAGGSNAGHVLPSMVYSQV